MSKEQRGFTPGPWRVERVIKTVGTVIWRGDLPENTNHARICRNVSSAANANLIAAAPDLYEACRTAHAFFSGLFRNVPEDKILPETRQYIEQLEEACAKAEGKGKSVDQR